MKRLILLAAFLLTSFASAGAFAQDGDVINTKNGLTYVKPSGWVDAGPSKGAVSRLHEAGDKKTQIELRFTPVTGDKAKSFFSAFHSSLSRKKLERKSNAAKTYGALSGTLSEYVAKTSSATKSIFVFEFTTDDGAWLGVGMFDGAKRDQALVAFEALLKSAQKQQ